MREPTEQPSVGTFTLKGCRSKFFRLHIWVPVRYPSSFCCNHANQFSIEQVPQRIVGVLDKERSFSIRTTTTSRSILAMTLLRFRTEAG